MFSAKHKWVKFKLQQCQLPSAALSLTAQSLESTESERERKREDISCIISCSAKRCLSDLVHDMPPCFSVSSSLALLYAILSLPVFLTIFLLPLPLDTACFPLSLFRYPSNTKTYPWPAAGSRGGAVRAKAGKFAPYSFQASRQTLPFPLHPFLTTCSRGSVFCCSWIALSKSLSFALSVCATRLTKTQTSFFQPEVLVLASRTALCNTTHPKTRTHTRTHTNHISPPLTKTPNISFLKQGRGGKRWGKKQSIFMKTNWTDV